MHSNIARSKEDEFDDFFNMAYNAYSMFKNYYCLYEISKERCDFLNTCAAPFFGDLQDMWHKHLVIDICKLMDNGKEDFSVNYWIKQLEDDREAVKLCGRMKKLHQKVVKARNKIIAHSDVKILRKGEALGKLSEGFEEIEEFYRNLESLMNIVAKQIFSDSSQHFRPLDPTGNDAEALISILQKGKKYTNNKLGK